MKNISVSGLTKKASTQSASLLLSRYGIIAVAVLLIFAAWAEQTLIVILLGLVLGLSGLTRLWSYWSLKGVSFERFLTERRVFPDEYLELRLKITNRKLLPLPWIEIMDQVPRGFVEGLTSNSEARPGYEVINRSSSILWYSAITWKYKLICSKRGYYPLGPLKVTSGDIFGFYPRTATETGIDYLIVYPRLYPVSHLSIPSLYPLGDVVSENRLFEDPSRTIGIRDYLPGDSLRRIHWKASARQQQLQVKIYEPSTTLRVALFLAVDNFRESGVWKEEELELGISTAASLANFMVEKNSQVGLWANTVKPDSNQPSRINPGSGVDTLIRIFEDLAKVVPISNIPFADFFQEERKKLPLGLTLVFILAEITEPIKTILVDLKESGYKLLVFKIGKADEKRELPGINVYFIEKPDDLRILI